jgi:hypothetical protein
LVNTQMQKYDIKADSKLRGVNVQMSYVELTRRMGGCGTLASVKGWGSPNSDDWRKSLALCLLCTFNLLNRNTQRGLAYIEGGVSSDSGPRTSGFPTGK